MLLRATVYGVVLSFLAAAGVVAQDVRNTPGPLEKQAKPVTPENPVPRRLTSRDVEYPVEMRVFGGRGLVGLQVTLDADGKVAEIRSVSAQIVQATGPINQAEQQQARDALSETAIAAVREWRFAAPAAAPLTFPVAFMFFNEKVDVTIAPPTTPARGRGTPPTGPGAPPWPAADGAYRFNAVTEPPRQTKNVRPQYPLEAQKKRISGIVILEIVVGPDGKVRDARVLRSVPELDQAALKAVRQWEYTPATVNGIAVPIVMTVTTTFTLN